MVSETRNRLLKLGFAAVIFLSVFASLVMTMRDAGMGWDEGNDVRMARGAGAWMDRFFFDGQGALTRDAIEKGWGYEWKQHPAVTRTYYALLYRVFGGMKAEPAYRDWFAYRICAALLFATMAVMVFYTGAKRLGCARAGLVAAVAIVCMPRMFGHAHFTETDTMLCAVYFAAAVAFLAGLEKPSGSIAFGVLAGLLPAVKFTGFFALVPFFLYGVIFEREKILRNAVAAVLIAPAVFVAVQPMYWHQPFSAFYEYISHFVNPQAQYSIVTHYLGQDYARTAPWHYPFIMVAVSVPLITLVPAVVGGAGAILKSDSRKYIVFFIINALFILFLFAPGRVAKYDGERLFMIAFPFIALLAAAGFELVFRRLHPVIGLIGFIIYSMLSVSFIMETRPFYLSYYNEIVGGIEGAEEKGFEISYWGETFTPELASALNEELPGGARLATIGYFTGNLNRFQEMGLLRSDINIVIYGQEADFLLLFNRRGVLDRRSRYILDNQKPVISIVKDEITFAGLYLLEPGVPLIEKR
ncbi:MAG TPA: glycosyltransferase family 39 protein [bacterium]|nr:glycosyltransferase family 39 protein [bacterium]